MPLWLRLHTETVTVIQKAGQASPGPDGVPVLPSGVRREWGPVNVQQVGTAESLGDERVVTTRIRVSGPVADWIGPGDRLEYRGAVYDVDGDPGTFRSGTLDHTELIASRSKGGGGGA